MLRPVEPQSIAQTFTNSVERGSTQDGTFGIVNQTGWLSGIPGRCLARSLGRGPDLGRAMAVETASADRLASGSSPAFVTAGAETVASSAAADSAGAVSVVGEAAALPDEADACGAAAAAACAV